MQPSLLCHGVSTLICACKFASLFSSLSIVPPWACSLSLPSPLLAYAEAVLYTRYLPTSTNQIPAMPQGIAPEYNSDEIGFTNREPVSLSIQYPDMPNMPDGDDESTPAADFGEDVDTSTSSDKTTHTTPLRNDPVALLGSRQLPEFPAFMQRLNESNLPQKALDYFKSLGHMILQVSRLLFPPAGSLSVTREDLQEASNICRAMVSLLKSSCQRVNDQIDNVTYILTLAPFTVQPAPEDLWANYTQMAELIIE